MDLKTVYTNTKLSPFYAGSSAIASINEDGTLLATPLLDQVNIINLLKPHEILHTIQNDDEQEITALKLTPNGAYLCFVSQAQLLKFYHLESKKVVRSMKVSSPVYVMDCDETSTLLATGGTDGSINIIDIEKGFITHSFKGHGGTISSLKFYGKLNSDIWRLGSGDTTGMVKVWDLVKRKCLHSVQDHVSAVRGLDFRINPNNKDELQLLSGARDNIVNFYDIDGKKKCKLTKTLPVNQQVESCGFLEYGTRTDLIYTAGGDAFYQILSLESLNIIKKTQKPIEELFIISVLPILDSTKLYLVFSDQTLFLLDIKSAINDKNNEFIQPEIKIAGNHGTIASMKFVGPHLNKLALATNSPTLRIIPTPIQEDGSLSNQISIDVEMYEGHKDLLNALDSTEDGRWIATASKDHSIILWVYQDDTNQYHQYAKFVGHAGPVTAISISNVITHSYPTFIISASADLTIKKWIIPQPVKDNSDTIIVNTSEYTRRAHEKDINALSISPNDSIFATASFDKTCKVWDLKTGELKATLSNHKRGLWDVSFCQYDRLLVTCSGDKTLKIWSLDTYSVIKTLEGHSNAVQKCSFINKNRQIVSAGADGLVKIWDCTTGESLCTLDGHNNRIWSLAILNDGDLIVTADADGVFQFWSNNSEEVKQEDLEKEKLKIEQEQYLQNYLSSGDWTNAFLLSIRLDHPMRLYNVLKQSTEYGQKSSTIFNQEIDDIVGTLNDDQLILLMRRCRDWNTNSFTYSIAQKMIRCILLKHNLPKLSEIPGMVQVIDAIIPYTQRHFSRIENLVEQSYILDYSLIEMDKLL